MGDYSRYPDGLDILSRIQDGNDKPTAFYFKQLFEGLRNVEAALGINPSTLGTDYGSFATIAALLSVVVRMEYGRIRVRIPNEVPVIVPFVSYPNRFVDRDKMIVHVFREDATSGRPVPSEARAAAFIYNDGGTTPRGFYFYRTNLDTGDATEESWWYLAIEDQLQ